MCGLVQKAQHTTARLKSTRCCSTHLETLVTTAGTSDHESGMAGHDAGIKENHPPGTEWSRSPESVGTMTGIRSLDSKHDC